MSNGLAFHTEFTGLSARATRQADNGDENEFEPTGKCPNQLWFIVGNDGQRGEAPRQITTVRHAFVADDTQTLERA